MRYNFSSRGLLDIRAHDDAIRQSAAAAAQNFRPSPPVIEPLREAPRPYNGLAKAAQGVGLAMDANDVLVQGAEAIGRKVLGSQVSLGLAKKLGTGLGRASKVATIFEEGFGAADAIQRGVPKSVAIPGAINRSAAVLGAGAAGGLIGTILGLGPFGTAVGATAGSAAAGHFLPDREVLGTGALHGVNAAVGLLNSFNKYAKPAAGGYLVTGTP